MRRSVIVCLLFAVVVWAANVRLYLKDGGYHLVREYQVLDDRVRYYSVERGDWEEIPLAMVDLKRTESEAADRQAELANDSRALAEEAAAQRSIEKETSRIPQAPGVYWLDGDQTKTMQVAEATVHINKKRQVLKVLAPIGQALSGKGTLEIDGAHSANVFTNPEQEFYIQLSEPERFGVARLTSKGLVRIVENITYLPVDKEVEESPALVETLQREMDPSGLYKIWPKDPLPEGEYAVIEYTPNALNIQIWDFSIQPKAPAK
ncbi:MAG: hypothetical protein ABSE42_13840 [Bryobacteraceae bacterium]|jgi:hypothetical protein